MASDKTLKTVISLAGKVDGSLGKALKSARSSTKATAKDMGNSLKSNMSTATSAMSKSLRGFLGTAAKIYATVKTFAQLKSFASDCISAAKDQIEVETKLESILSNVQSIAIRGPNAAAEAANKLKDVASNLQSVGVIGDEVTLAGMQQLATFQLSEDQITTLSAGMADLLAQQKGLNASQSDAVSIGNMIGKAMNGSASALSKVGISFTEAQKKVIETGNATQRAATIAEVLQMNVGGVNEALAKTDQGKIQQATNTLGDMKETIGMYLLPLLAKLANKGMPLVEAGFKLITDACDKLEPILGNLIDNGMTKLSEVLPEIQKVAKQLTPALKSMSSAIKPITKSVRNALLPALSKIAPMISNGIISLMPTVIALIEQLAPIIADVLTNLVPVIGQIVSALLPAIQELLPLIGSLAQTLLPPIMQVISTIAPLIAQILSQLAPLISNLVEGLLPALSSILQPIISLVQTLLPPLSSLFTAIFEVLEKLSPIIVLVANAIATQFANAVNIATPIVVSLIDTVTGIADVLGSVIDFLCNVFTGNWSAAWNNLGQIVVGIFNGVKSAIRGILQGLVSPINALIDGVNSISSKVPGWDGLNISHITIPAFAEGTTLTQATLCIAGEAGPETIVPHNNKPRSVALLKEAAAGVGVGIGGTTQLVYSPTIYANDAEGVKEVLDDDYERFKQYAEQYREEQEREGF